MAGRQGEFLPESFIRMHPFHLRGFDIDQVLDIHRATTRDSALIFPTGRTEEGYRYERLIRRKVALDILAGLSREGNQKFAWWLRARTYFCSHTHPVGLLWLRFNLDVEIKNGLEMKWPSAYGQL